MNVLHFALLALFTFCISVWVNLNLAESDQLFWPTLLISPIIFMSFALLVTKTCKFFLKVLGGK